MQRQIFFNRIRSAALVLVVLGIAGGLGYLLGRVFGRAGWVGAGIALAVAAAIALWSYFLGDRAVLRASRARPVDTAEEPRLHNVVDGLVPVAGLPRKPRLFVIPEAAPNALAAGRSPRHAKVAVTQGLLDTMNRVELEGVLAHEVAHVADRDMLVGTLVATLVGMVTLLGGWARSAFLWGGAEARRGGSVIGWLLVPVFALGAILSLFTPLVAQMTRLAVTRRREFLADAQGALFTRYPPGLAHALRKIAAFPNQMRVANNATAHLWLSQPSRAPGFGHTFVERLFSTHPPLEERIKALEEM